MYELSIYPPTHLPTLPMVCTSQEEKVLFMRGVKMSRWEEEEEEEEEAIGGLLFRFFLGGEEEKEEEKEEEEEEEEIGGSARFWPVVLVAAGFGWVGGWVGGWRG